MRGIVESIRYFFAEGSLRLPAQSRSNFLFKMKFFVAVLALFVSLATAEYVVKTRENLVQYRLECVDELKIPANYVEQFKKWEFPNDAVTQCYLKCVFGKFGLFDTQSGFNVENVHLQLLGNASTDNHDDTTHAKIQSCVDNNEQGSNACEWAYRGATCFFKNNLRLVQKSVSPTQA